ncbi:MAG: T9SS type A sorting domain-containing protein, partial [Bacteroidales bacterium]
TTYAWTNNQTSIGLAANGTGNILGFTAINNGTVPVTATIVVTPTFTNEGVSCNGPDSSFTIRVEPSANPIINGDTVVCCNVSKTYCDIDNTTGSYSYQWTISGGIIESVANTNCVTVKWNCNCTTGWLRLTKTNLNTGCATTTGYHNVTINPLPTPTINGNTTVYTNATGELYYVTPSIPGHLYSWSVIGGSITSGQGNDSVYVSWDWAPCQACQGSISVSETAPTGCTGTTTISITQLPAPGAYKLTGKLTYDNTNNTPLNGVSIQLVKDGEVIATTTTVTTINQSGNAVSGYYEFNNIAYGNYSLNVSSVKPWGGVTATDALLIKLHSVGSITLTDLPLVAANVNLASGVNATDALLVQLRIVSLINQFAAGDWKFNNAPFTFSALDSTYNFKGICVGDINKSYNTTYLKQAISTNDGVVDIQQSKSFTYTIKANTSAKLGAMTLFMNYDQNSFEIENVNNTLDGMKYKIENGQIALAWADLNAKTITSGETLISLQIRARKAIMHPTQIFNYDVSSEFADPNAVVLDNFNLKMSDVQTVNQEKGFNVQNYPNPAREITNIVYTLPEQGKVKIIITNILGQPIRTIVDEEQSEGIYKVIISASDLNLFSGVYMYQIEVNGITTNYSKLGKIVFER